MKQTIRWSILFALVLVIGTRAQEAAPDTASSPAEPLTDIKEVVLIGSRGEARSSLESSVPVDVIGDQVLASQGITDPMDLLSSMVPSMHTFQPSISGGSTFVRPIVLRNLPPESTLVMVNGKRRHRASVVSLITAGTADGSQGVDIHAIPYLALKRVEVLRDGTSAQYGSDAVAGVLNFVLKDEAGGGSVETRWGQFYEGDGTSYTVAANSGMPIPVGGENRGFANFSLEYTRADDTVRAVQRADAAAMTLAGYDVMDPVVPWGSPEVDLDLKFSINAGLELSDHAEMYVFASYNRRELNGTYFFRNPTTTYGQQGIYRTYRTGETGDFLLLPPYRHLVADLRQNPDPKTTPVIRSVDVNGDELPDFPIPDDFIAVSTANPANRDPDNPGNPAFVTVNEIHPNGFTPHFSVNIDDFSVAGGVRGNLESQWHYDLGAIAGRHQSHYHILNTINPQLFAHPDYRDDPASVPLDYDTGKYVEMDYTVNLDLSRPFETGFLFSPLNVAVGLEYRMEEFSIHAGDWQGSYVDDREGGLFDQGFSAGASGSPSFTPEDASTTSRGSYSAYLDLEADVVENLLIGAAARFEDYEDFGSTLNGKLSARYQFHPNVALRGSVNTAFRAPTAGQVGLRNLGSAFDGWPPTLVSVAILPPGDPVARELGARPLEPETSFNHGLGTVITFRDLEVTLDYYNIRIDDRIYLTDYIPISGEFAASTRGNRARYFTNAFDTTTQGLELVASYPLEHRLGTTLLTAAFNVSDTEVDAIRDNPNALAITPQRVDQIENNLPDMRMVFSAVNRMGPWTLTTRLRYYGDYIEYHADLEALRFQAESQWLVDLEGQYSFENGLSLVAGARNLFDSYPVRPPAAMRDITGAAYSHSSPFGFNGGFYYLKAIYSW